MTMMVVTNMMTILVMAVVSEVIKVLMGLSQPMLAGTFAFASSLNVFIHGTLMLLLCQSYAPASRSM